MSGDMLNELLLVAMCLAALCMADYQMRNDCGIRQRRQKVLCRHCGYNLTGNISGVCPECGTSVPL